MSQRLDELLERAFPDAEGLPTMEDLEVAGIRLAMKRFGGNRKRTAERLMISRATLYRRLDPHGRVIRRKSGIVDAHTTGNEPGMRTKGRSSAPVAGSGRWPTGQSSRRSSTTSPAPKPDGALNKN